MSKMATGLDRYFAKSLGGKLVFGFIDQNWPRFSVQCEHVLWQVTLKSGPESIVQGVPQILSPVYV